MTIYLYVRSSESEVSAGSHREEGALHDGLAAEWNAMQQLCEDRRWGPGVPVTDSCAAWNTDFAARSGGRALLDQLQAGDVIVVYALERVFSSCYDAITTLERLQATGVQLFVVTLGGNAADPALQFDLVSAARLFAALERRRSVERIKNIKKDQRNKGRFLGGSRPFGYMIHSNGRLIENPMEQKVLKRIMQLREQGLSLRSIAAQVSTPVAPVSFKTVQRILQRNV